MPGNKISIDQLKIRIPGTDRKEAGDIAREVARSLTQKLPSSVRNSHPGALNIRLSIDREASPAEKIQRITQAILTGLE